MTYPNEDSDMDFGALLARRVRRAAIVILAPLLIGGLATLYLLRQHLEAADFSNVFVSLRDEIVDVEFNLNRAILSDDSDRAAYLGALETQYEGLLALFAALHATDTTAAAAPYLALAAERGIDPVAESRSLGIYGTPMPRVLAEIWMQTPEATADAAIPSLKMSIAAILDELDKLFAENGPRSDALVDARRAILDQLGPANHHHMRNISAILTARMDLGVRLPLYLLIGIVGVVIAGLWMANSTILRPFGARLRGLQRDLIEAREKAHQSERAKSEFLASMSHEIRTPMNGVMGMAELIAGTELDSRQRTFVEIIQSSARSLLSIINDVLDVSRISSGQMQFSEDVFKLGRLVAEPVKMLSEDAFSKGIDLTLRVAPGTERFVVGDPGRLRQVLTNLIGNAVKFTPAGQVDVDVRTEPDGDGLRLLIEVRDTGIGIPADQLDAIFERFTQVDQSSVREQEGTGLGLAISKGLVEGMGGRIDVESLIGVGSVFRIELPLKRHAVTEVVTSAPMDLKGARLLVVDDNETNRLILHEQLAAWGLHTDTAASGREALQKLVAASSSGRPYDLALLDHHMPGMDGVELARRIRSAEELSATALVILSSIADVLATETMAELGLQGHLCKPALASPLFDAIVKAFSRTEPDEERSDQDTLRPASASVASGAARVLVVDDNSVNRRVAELMLDQHDVWVDMAGDGLEAIERYVARRPSLVLMDISMPGLDGLEATRRIREIEARHGWPAVPIVAMTAHVMAADREACLEIGMTDYLAKPLESAALSRIIAAHLTMRDVETSTRVS